MDQVLTWAVYILGGLLMWIGFHISRGYSQQKNRSGNGDYREMAGSNVALPPECPDLSVLEDLFGAMDVKIKENFAPTALQNTQWTIVASDTAGRTPIKLASVEYTMELHKDFDECFEVNIERVELGGPLIIYLLAQDSRWKYYADVSSRSKGKYYPLKGIRRDTVEVLNFMSDIRNRVRNFREKEAV